MKTKRRVDGYQSIISNINYKRGDHASRIGISSIFNLNERNKNYIMCIIIIILKGATLLDDPDKLYRLVPRTLTEHLRSKCVFMIIDFGNKNIILVFTDCFH